MNNLRQVAKSQTLLLNEQSRNIEVSGREIFKFGFGQSPFPPLPAAVDALRVHAAAKDYTPVQGLLDLRARVAAFHVDAFGLRARAEQVLVAPGSKILLYTVMAAFERADVLIPAPAWVSYAPQAKLLGHTPIRVATSFEQRWRATPEAIADALRRKSDAGVPSLLVLNHPGNPDGLSYTSSELEAIARVCNRHEVLVISDEIYGLLDHRGEHVSLAAYYPERTIVTGGLSKWCGAGGWRLGVAVLPHELLGDFSETLVGIASETYSCAPLPVQMAACEAYQWNSATRDYLAHQRRVLDHIGQITARQLIKAGVNLHLPTGGFYLFPDFTPFADRLHRAGIHSSQALCERLLADTGVALLPGDAFGMAPDHLCARLAYVEFDGAHALAVSRELRLDRPFDDAASHVLFAKTVRGTLRLTQWLATL
ncbi:pyridoxal phosphate-dependent aminotransferase [Piscinibacter terrae]|nr:aminotransferase class I/II-fold pyridoxal phosphate-dependent enzyme [Albitalea terrae]